jgi:hypothetical protein
MKGGRLDKTMPSEQASIADLSQEMREIQTFEKTP